MSRRSGRQRAPERARRRGSERKGRIHESSHPHPARAGGVRRAGHDGLTPRPRPAASRARSSTPRAACCPAPRSPSPRSGRATPAPPRPTPQGAYVFVNLPLGTLQRERRAHGLQEGAERSGFVLVADGRVTADFTLEVGGLNETVEVTVDERDGQHGLRRDRADGRPPAGPEPGPERPQLPAAHHPHPRRARPQPERARHHDRPRHQHVDQRQPHERDPAHRRRRLQHGLGLEQQPDQQRRRRLHRGGRDQDRELLRRVRAQLRARRSTS